MSTINSITQPAAEQARQHYSHEDCTKYLDAYFSLKDRPSLRQFARDNGIPESTFRSWVKRHEAIGVEAATRLFLQSPAGQAFLKKLVASAVVTFQMSGITGLRPIESFLKHAGCAPFAATSYGSLQRFTRVLEDLALAFDQGQRPLMAAELPQRLISAALDENFHMGPCLVASDVVSNFIFAESYRDNRNADTWEAVVSEGLKGLNVTIEQVVSDDAKALKAFAQSQSAQHSPDLMHIQQRLHQGLSLPLASQVQKAKELVEDCQDTYDKANAALQNAPSKELPQAQREFDAASKARSQAQSRQARCEKNQEETQEAIKDFGDAYHPFDKETGELVERTEMDKKLQKPLVEIKKVAEDAGLSSKAYQKINSVWLMLAVMLGTLDWFWKRVNQELDKEEMSEATKKWFKEKLMSWAYWLQASEKGRDSKERKRLRELAGKRLKELEEDSRWQSLSKEEQQRLQKLAIELVSKWQRSSSCVEGRNGRLRLAQHAKQGLSQRGLKILTILHNYWNRRDDGSTAAERFFGKPQENFFDWLLQRAPSLRRSRRNSPKPA